jgi:hypothetical protein
MYLMTCLALVQEGMMCTGVLFDVHQTCLPVVLLLVISLLWYDTM